VRGDTQLTEHVHEQALLVGRHLGIEQDVGLE